MANPVIDIVDDYGADPTGLTAADSLIQAAIDQNPDTKIFVPRGKYRITRPIEVRNHCYLFGYGSAMSWYLPSKLVCDPGITALHFHDDRNTGGAQYSRVSDLAIEMINYGAEYPDANGLLANVCLEAKRLLVKGFSGAGIKVYGATNNPDHPPCAANLFKLRSVQIEECDIGLHVGGYDGNAGLFEDVSTTANRGLGIWDESALGNCYVACHTRSNQAGGYRIGVDSSGVNHSTLTGCYAEADTGPSKLGDMVWWFGGIPESGLEGGQVLTAGNCRIRLQAQGQAITPPLQVMAARDMLCSLVEILDANGKPTIEISGAGVLGLGQPTGTPPGSGDASPPYIIIRESGDRPLMVFGGVGISGHDYNAGVGRLVLRAVGPNYGQAGMILQTMDDQSTYVDTVQVIDGHALVWDCDHWESLT